MMIVNRARKEIHKKCVIVLICLLMFGSLACGAVLCFGSEGRVSIKLKPTDHCDEYLGIPVQASPNSCGQCIDIPIYTGLAKITRVSKQLNPTLQVSTTTVPAITVDRDSSEYQLGSELFTIVNPSLTSLRTIILLI